MAALNLDVQASAPFSQTPHVVTVKSWDILINGVARSAVAGEGIALFAADNKLLAGQNMDAAKIVGNLRQAPAGLSVYGYDACLIDGPAAFGVHSMAGLVADDVLASSASSML